MWCGEVSLKEFFLIYSPVHCGSLYKLVRECITLEFEDCWPVHNWETGSLDALCLLYDVQVCRVGENVICWRSSRSRKSEVRSFYLLLCGNRENSR